MINKYFFKSLIYFFTNIFKNKKYDVVFYYPVHFNRSGNQNNFFEPLYKICKKNNLKYLVIEEPEFGEKVFRNNSTIPFDFMLVLVLILRKIIPLKKFETFEHREWFIGAILKKTFLRNFHFNNLIVLSNSMLGIFRGLNKDGKLFDYQHGVITSSHGGYISENNTPSKHIKVNNSNVLVYGKNFKKVLTTAIKDDYYDNHCFVLGQAIKSNYQYNYKEKNVLFSLQFVDKNIERNKKIYLFLEDLIIKSKEFFIKNNIILLLKHHPRFSNEIDLSSLYDLSFVKVFEKDLLSGLKESFLHMTLHSTTTFEASSFGIPTILLDNDILNPSFFVDDYNFPLGILEKNEFTNKMQHYLSDEKVYESDSKKVFSWYQDFYSDIDEKMFIKLMKGKNEKN